LTTIPANKYQSLKPKNLVMRNSEFSNNRDNRLNSFREKFRKNLDDTNRELRSHIKQILSRDFEDELSNAEFSAKKGHMIDAAVHEQLADIINNFLKTYD